MAKSIWYPGSQPARPVQPSGHPLNDGLAYWSPSVDATGSKMPNIVQRSDDGAFQNGAQWVPSSRPGGGFAMLGNGNNARAVVPVSPALVPITTTALTLTAWFRCDDLTKINYLLDRQWGGRSQYSWWIDSTNNDNQLTFRNGNTGRRSILRANGEWHFAAVVMRDNAGSMYLDGEWDENFHLTFPGETPNDGDSPTNIGTRWDAAFGMDGQIAEVRIYDRPLARAELDTLYEDTQRGFPLTLQRNRFQIAFPSAPPTPTKKTTIYIPSQPKRPLEISNRAVNHELVGYWPTYDDTGLIIRDIARHQSAALVQGVGSGWNWWAPVDEPNCRYALQFSGASPPRTYVTPPPIPMPENQPFSFACRFETDGLDDSTADLMTYDQTGASRRYASLRMFSATGQVQAEVGGDSGSGFVQTVASYVGLGVGRHHALVTYAGGIGGRIALFIDGQLIGTDVASFDGAESAWNFGRSPRGGGEDHFTGTLSDFRIWRADLFSAAAAVFASTYDDTLKRDVYQIKKAEDVFLESLLTHWPAVLPTLEVGTQLDLVSIPTHWPPVEPTVEAAVQLDLDPQLTHWPVIEPTVTVADTIELDPIPTHWTTADPTLMVGVQLGVTPIGTQWIPQAPALEVGTELALASVPTHWVPNPPTMLSDTLIDLDSQVTHWPVVPPTVIAGEDINLPPQLTHWTISDPTVSVGVELDIDSLATHWEPQAPTLTVGTELFVAPLLTYWNPIEPSLEDFVNLNPVVTHWDVVPANLDVGTELALDAVPTHWVVVPPFMEDEDMPLDPIPTNWTISPPVFSIGSEVQVDSQPTHWIVQAPTLPAQSFRFVASPPQTWTGGARHVQVWTGGAKGAQVWS